MSQGGGSSFLYDCVDVVYAVLPPPPTCPPQQLEEGGVGETSVLVESRQNRRLQET